MNWHPYKDLTAEELEAKPSLSEDYTSDMKIDDGEYRVHLERTGIADGEWCDNKVTVEQLQDGKWVIIDEYEGK